MLQKRGMMPLALKILRMFDINLLKNFFKGLKFYIFNDFLTYIPNHFLRLMCLRYILGIKVGKSCFIHMGCRFEGKISIGNNTVIGRRCVLLGEITIKNNVSITAETYIFTTTHIVDSRSFEAVYSSVVIEDYVWIGARAMILPGIIIGKGAVLGAASTATKNIPEFSIFVGSPAKEVGKRSMLIDYKLIYTPFFQ